MTGIFDIPNPLDDTDFGPYVAELTGTPYKRSTPCRLPISDMASWMYDLVSNGLAFINPLSKYYAFSGQLAVDLGGCFNHLITTDDLFNAGGVGNQSLLDVIGLDKFNDVKQVATLVSSMEPLQPPPGFPKDFTSYFPDGFKPGFEAAFMAGLPDPSAFGLPPTFRASFEALVARIKIQDLSPPYVAALAELGVRVPALGLAKVFVDSAFAYPSWDAIPEDDLDRLQGWGVPIYADFAKDPKYIAKLNALHLLVPPGGFAWYIPNETPAIPPVGFPGFDPAFVARLGSQYQQDKRSLDLLSGAQRNPIGVNTSKLDFLSAAGAAFSAYQIAETVGYQSFVDDPASALEGTFGVLTGSLDEKYETIAQALGSLTGMLCGDPGTAVQSILKGEFDAAVRQLKAALDLIKREVENVTLRHLANVALNMLFGQSNAMLQFIIPRVSGAQGYCKALDKATEALEHPALSSLLDTVTKNAQSLQEALTPKSAITGASLF